ncbi:MAG: transcription antitermination protein RfaH [Nitrospirales bacterium]|nr:MAG: transcription antitermination protein RfaH [Nitrospirales bacterium]
MNRNWYLIHTKARQESSAEMNLRRLGVETFLPCIRHSKSGRDKCKADELEPLFPGYLFVRVDMSTEFRKVAYSHGVLNVVKFGSTPAYVENEIINSIKARGNNGLIILPPSALKMGETVVVSKGPFRGFEAIFDGEVNGLQRVSILLKTVAYQARMVVNRDCITVASERVSYI